MIDQLRSFFSSTAYAVVGASEDRGKYGNIAYRVLRNKKFSVYPVNPNRASIEGDRCFPNVSALPDEVKSLVLVVQPHITEQVLTKCKVKGISSVWMQPGAESMEAIAFATANNIAVIHDACIMVMLSPVREYKHIQEWLTRAESSYS